MSQPLKVGRKKQTHVPPGSPICANHRQQVNSWVSEKEQRESSNVEEEALNADIFPEEGQGVKEAARADSGEEDEGSGEQD